MNLKSISILVFIFGILISLSSFYLSENEINKNIIYNDELSTNFITS